MNEDFDFYVEYWNKVMLTENELDALCNAADAGDIEVADRIVHGAYDRLFGESIS